MTSLSDVVVGARRAFEDNRTLDIDYRKRQLKQLMKLLDENEDLFVSALHQDLGRPRFETVLTDIDYVRNECRGALFSLDDWIKPQPAAKNLVTFFDTAYIKPEPYGVVLIIGTWNYPVHVTLAPLVGAIAAGNAAVIKPSEVAPASAELIERLLATYLDCECYKVVTGAADVTQKLLQEQFDYIMYTGSASIGRLIHQAAAKNLTPCTLELGGKSPVYIDTTVSNRYMAWKRIIWGKIINCGQTCVAPDYLLCSKELEADLLKWAPIIVKEFQKSANKTEQLTRIINERHFERLTNLIQNTRGQIKFGGNFDRKKLQIDITIVTDVQPNDSLMSEEIFGPILPVITVNTPAEAIKLINSRDRPLTLYVFSNDSQVVQLFETKTWSGSICANDTLLHMTVDALPFGGIGPSGFGNYHGQYTFETFSHQKSVLIRNYNPILEWVASKRYPPYSENHLVRLLRLLRKRKIIQVLTVFPWRYLFLIGFGYMLHHLTSF